MSIQLRIILSNNKIKKICVDRNIWNILSSLIKPK